MRRLLACITHDPPIRTSSIVDVVCSVPGPSNGRPTESLEPSRISETFNDAALREAVDNTATRTETLPEVRICWRSLLELYVHGGINRVNNKSAPENSSPFRPFDLCMTNFEKIDIAKVRYYRKSCGGSNN